MRGFKLIHVGKMGPWFRLCWIDPSPAELFMRKHQFMYLGILHFLTEVVHSVEILLREIQGPVTLFSWFD